MKYLGKNTNLKVLPISLKRVSANYTGLEDPYYTSIQAAINAASTGDTVEVFTGQYDERITLRSEVNLYFHPGAVIAPKNESGTAIIGASSVTCSISGYLEINHTAAVNTPQLIDISGTSNINIEMKRAVGVHTGGILVSNTSILTLKIDYIENTIQANNTGLVTVYGDVLWELRVSASGAIMNVFTNKFRNIVQTAGILKMYFSETTETTNGDVYVTDGFCWLIDGELKHVPGYNSYPVRVAGDTAKIRLQHVKINNPNGNPCIYIAAGTVITDNCCLVTTYQYSVDWGGSGTYKNWGSVSNKVTNPGITTLIQALLVSTSVE